MTPVLAHPLTDPGRLEIPPLAAAVVVMVLVAVVARFWPGPRPRGGAAEPPGVPAFEVHSWWGSLGRLQVAGRVVALLLVVLAVVAGRVGSESDLENVAPALILGAGWPLLVAASLLLGAVWRWADPWDVAARALDRSEGGPPAEDVWWAVAPAGLFAWYVGAYPEPYDPRTLSLGLGLYALVMVGGALLLGRQRFLSRTEVFGLFLSWSAILRRRLAVRWTTPAGTEVVLGTLAGGLVFGSIRRSSLWGGLNVVPGANLYATMGLAAAAAGVAASLWWLERRAGRSGAAGSVPAAAVPAVAAMALALAMSSDVLFTSISLLPRLLADPLGGGSSPGGVALLGLCPEGVLTCARLVAVQAGVVLGGGVAGAILLARRVPDPAHRPPGMAALCLIVAGGVVAITAS